MRNRCSFIFSLEDGFVHKLRTLSERFRGTGPETRPDDEISPDLPPSKEGILIILLPATPNVEALCRPI
jgi:hypothetical protein